MIGVASHHPTNLELLALQNVVDVYTKVIDEAFIGIYHNYTNVVYINSSSKATLRYKPHNRSLRITVNGYPYEEGVHYTFDREQRLFEWTFTKANGGFDLRYDDRIIALYNISVVDNNLNSINDVVLQPNN